MKLRPNKANMNKICEVTKSISKKKQLKLQDTTMQYRDTQPQDYGRENPNQVIRNQVRLIL